MSLGVIINSDRYNNIYLLAMSDVIIITIIMILPYALSKFNSEFSSTEGTSEGIMSLILTFLQTGIHDRIWEFTGYM